MAQVEREAIFLAGCIWRHRWGHSRRWRLTWCDRGHRAAGGPAKHTAFRHNTSSLPTWVTGSRAGTSRQIT